MKKHEKLNILLECIDPYIEAEDVFVKRYPFAYHTGVKKVKYRSIIKTFYEKSIPEKYGYKAVVIEDNMVDWAHTQRLPDSYEGAFYVKSRGRGVTVWIGPDYFELIVKVKYFKYLS
jgi:hypothetical protein